jgi:hypothetical protein
MKASFSGAFLNQRVIPDRRSHPTSFISTLRFGGRRKGFRRKGEGSSQYVDCISPRIIVLTFVISFFSSLDAILTFFQLENGASELNPLMRQIIQSGFQSTLIFKSVVVGLIACFLASLQNFKISFYAMYVLATVYVAVLAYHLICIYVAISF